jgi:hypothetical protein
VRGGAIPLLALGTVLLVMLALNWIWTGDAIQVGSFGFAVLALYGGGLALWLARRESLRRGPPPPHTDPETVPELSVTATAVGFSVAAILFGVVWAAFLVYFGVGLLLLSLGRWAIELRSERESRERAGGGEPPR